MTHRAQSIIDQALALSPDEREQIGTALLDSLDDEHHETVAHRIDELERGEADVRDAMDVYHRLRAQRRG